MDRSGGAAEYLASGAVVGGDGQTGTRAQGRSRLSVHVDADQSRAPDRGSGQQSSTQGDQPDSVRLGQAPRPDQAGDLSQPVAKPRNGGHAERVEPAQPGQGCGDDGRL
jgi:hypothetical protein